MKSINREDDLSVLSLSVRTKNGLIASNILTVGDLLNYPKEGFEKIPNLGKKSIDELYSVLKLLKGEDVSMCKKGAPNIGAKDYTIIINEVGEVVHDIPVTDLPLSARSLNCLTSNGYNYVSQLTRLTYEILIDLPQMGKKSAEEVLELISKIKVQHGEIVPRYMILNAAGVVVHDIDIKETSLSVRAKNCLINNGYTHASKLTGISFQTLMNLPNMGNKSAREVWNFLSKTIIATHTSEVAENVDVFIASLVEEMVQAYGEEEDVWLREINSVKTLFPDVLGETLIYRLYEKAFVRGVVKARILQLLEEHEGVRSNAFLEKWKPSHLNNTIILKEILLELESACAIEIGENMIYRQFPSITRFVKQLEDVRVKEVLLARLEGKTLQEIGELYHLTRERVRQLSLKGLRAKPRLREDLYSYIFNNYNFSQEDLQFAFGEPLSTYCYLEMTSTQARLARKPIEDILKDDTVSADFRRKAEKIINKDCVAIDGVLVQKRRAELLKGVARKCCKTVTRYEDFLREYCVQINELGLGNDESFVLNERSCANMLNGCDYILWNQWRRLRYYDISEYDFTELLTVLNLKQYENLEISTLKLFRDFPNLMKQYDIQDEYELHNLLKKIWPSNEVRVNFKKMPTIEIGCADVTEQVRALLFRTAPISADDLANLYEDEYGVKAGTVRGSYLRDFGCYFHDGVYSVDYQELAEEQYKRLQELLVDDFYTIDKIQSLFKCEYPHLDEKKAINPYVLKQLHFHVYSGYVIKDTYAMATDYFHHILTMNPVFDIRNINKCIQALSAFLSELLDIRATYEIIEFLPYQYLNISRLEQAGIGKDYLRKFCQQIASTYEEGEFFTIKSLRQDGFIFELDEFGFDDWFYSSILLEDKEHFSWQRMGGNRFFYRGKGKGGFGDMLVWILGQKQKIDIYDLLDLLDASYGIKVRKDKLLAIIGNTELYYDTIMEAVYINYDTYFEEV